MIKILHNILVNTTFLRQRLFVTFAFLSMLGYGQEPVNTPSADTSNTQDIQLEELMKLQSTGVSSELEKTINQKLDVASKKPMSSKKSPSIVSVVTAEDIFKSGARDLIDVMRLVPGFDFGVDVQNTVGLGIRGNWAQEGKYLVLLDGQEMNEALYGTVNWGNNFPIEHIKRIEIIRGPGSAIYGGYAEYGVINIITINADDLSGVKAGIYYGQMKNSYGRANGSLYLGKNFKGLKVNLGARIGMGQRSDVNYTDVYGNSFNMAGNSALNPIYANLGISYKGLEFRGIIDDLNSVTRDGYDVSLSKAYPNNSKGTYLELKYNWKPVQNLTITPKVNFKRQYAYTNPQLADSGDVYDIYNKYNDRFRANVTASWDITQKINLIAGVETFIDNAHSLASDTSLAFQIPSGDTNNTHYTKNVTYYNYAAFVQGLIRNKIVNVTLGARYDRNSAFGSAFVPRVGLVKGIGKFNFKLLYSNSFRAPAIENISSAYNGTIKPEYSTVFEFETAFQINHNSTIAVNVFDITTKNAIIFYSVGSHDFYKNSTNTGSTGFELEYKYKSELMYIVANYSFYTSGNSTLPPSYQVPGNGNVALGFAAHRVNLETYFNITKKLSIAPTASFMSDRYAYTTTDSAGGLVLTKLPPALLANIFVNYNNLLPGLSLGAGCYNLLDNPYKFAQPYNSGHAPLPGQSREFVIRLSYTFDTNSKTILQ